MTIARPWQSGLDQNKAVIIHGPDDDDGLSDVVLVDGEYLSEEEAALIVKAVNAHDSLVAALEKCCDFISEEMGSINVLTPEGMARAALEEAKP